MQFLIADTFTDSLARLTSDEQKAVKQTAFDLQVNPAHPGLQFHRLDRIRDKRFWSVRVGRDIRIIVHRSDQALLLCYVNHHDKAYAWAGRRKLETHPKTGAAQLVEVRETVREIVVPVYTQKVQSASPTPSPLADMDADRLLAFGVPEEWLEDLKKADEDELLAMVEHLPAEAAEAVLELATGGSPEPPVPAKSEADPFEHPDAKRRFRIMANSEELERALEFPWDKWSIFLHPAQRDVVERRYSGPARVSGSAGTGKTIAALHRAVHLARKNPTAMVLLATFSPVLANALHQKLKRLVQGEPQLAERIAVHALDEVGERLYRGIGASGKRMDADAQRAMVLEEATRLDLAYSKTFLWDEWRHVVDPWQIRTWEEYRTVPRLGRRSRLAEAKRETLWRLFETVLRRLEDEGWISPAGMFSALADYYGQGKRSPYAHVVLDEAQDVSISQLRFLAAIGGKQEDGLFFAGDLGQRIFQQPFSWSSLGVEVRGRARVLKVNYRTSHQIRQQADRLLGDEVQDADGNKESRTGTVSVFNGPKPELHLFEDPEVEQHAVLQWLQARRSEGVPVGEIGLIVRSDAQMSRAEAVAQAADVPYRLLDDRMQTSSSELSLITMHRAKGLEYRAVAVMACDESVLPDEARLTAVGDMGDLEETYQTERHLLYVACTRARDSLWVSGIEPGSEFLEDLEL